MPAYASAASPSPNTSNCSSSEPGCNSGGDSSGPVRCMEPQITDAPSVLASEAVDQSLYT